MRYGANINFPYIEKEESSDKSIVDDLNTIDKILEEVEETEISERKKSSFKEKKRGIDLNEK